MLQYVVPLARNMVHLNTERSTIKKMLCMKCICLGVKTAWLTIGTCGAWRKEERQ